jgi:hypothetical protein
VDGEIIDLISPDNTTDGCLRKKWIIEDGKRRLVKGGSALLWQEPLNEVLATTIMRQLDISHVPYILTWQHDEPYSVCDNFLTPQTELVSAWRIMQTRKQPGNISNYQHFLICCEALGIPGAEFAAAQMIALDFLIVNEDRHFNNFGTIRDAGSLEWIGLAPIYDSGTSMWQTTKLVDIADDANDIFKQSPYAVAIY